MPSPLDNLMTYTNHRIEAFRRIKDEITKTGDKTQEQIQRQWRYLQGEVEAASSLESLIARQKIERISATAEVLSRELAARGTQSSAQIHSRSRAAQAKADRENQLLLARISRGDAGNLSKTVEDEILESSRMANPADIAARIKSVVAPNYQVLVKKNPAAALRYLRETADGFKSVHPDKPGTVDEAYRTLFGVTPEDYSLAEEEAILDSEFAAGSSSDGAGGGGLPAGAVRPRTRAERIGLSPIPGVDDEERVLEYADRAAFNKERINNPALTREEWESMPERAALTKALYNGPDEDFYIYGDDSLVEQMITARGMRASIDERKAALDKMAATNLSPAEAHDAALREFARRGAYGRGGVDQVQAYDRALLDMGRTAAAQGGTIRPPASSFLSQPTMEQLDRREEFDNLDLLESEQAKNPDSRQVVGPRLLGELRSQEGARSAELEGGDVIVETPDDVRLRLGTQYRVRTAAEEEDIDFSKIPNAEEDPEPTIEEDPAGPQGLYKRALDASDRALAIVQGKTAAELTDEESEELNAMIAIQQEVAADLIDPNSKLMSGLDRTSLDTLQSKLMASAKAIVAADPAQKGESKAPKIQQQRIAQASNKGAELAASTLRASKSGSFDAPAELKKAFGKNALQSADIAMTSQLAKQKGAPKPGSAEAVRQLSRIAGRRWAQPDVREQIVALYTAYTDRQNG